MMHLFLAAEAAQQPGGSAYIMQIVPIVIFFFIFYYLFVAMPMKKKQKAFQDLMNNLKAGDRVLTNSGMYGIVTGMTDKIVKLRVANNVVVDMDKSAISGLATEETKEEKK